jgi:hypothetical protein
MCKISTKMHKKAKNVGKKIVNSFTFETFNRFLPKNDFSFSYIILLRVSNIKKKIKTGELGINGPIS